MIIKNSPDIYFLDLNKKKARQKLPGYLNLFF